MYFNVREKIFSLQEPLSQKFIQRRQDFRKISQNPRAVLALINADFSSTYQKDLKLGKCLDMGDMTQYIWWGHMT